MGLNDNSRLTFKFNNEVTVREMILTNCLKNGNESKISGKFPPCHMAAIYLVTYSEKIALENKDGFLWPPTGWTMKNKGSLKTVQFVLRQQGILTTESMKHNIILLGQTTINGTPTSFFRLNMSKVHGPGKLIFV